jgi:cytochrome c5
MKKNMSWTRLWVGAILLGSTFSIAQKANPPMVDAKTGTDKKQSTGASQDPGEKAFQANCSRCHSAPEQLSPRIAGTVTQHMRVRASLSAKDRQAILQYLAP